MAWLDSSDLRAKMAALEAAFMDALQQADPKGVVARIAQETTIDSESVTIGWNDLIGTLTEWVGERKVRDLQARSITVTPRHWERTVGIDKDHLADDKLGLAMESMQRLAGIVALDYRVKLVAKLMAGFTDLGWDGKAIFAADHPIEVDGVASTLDNLSDQNPDATGLAEALLYFDSLKAPDGSPLYVEPDLLVCGPEQRATAEATLKSDRLANGASNINFQRCDMLVDPGVTGTYWFLLSTSVVKPVRLVKRKLAEVKFDEPYMLNQYLAGVDARHDALHTTYQVMWGSTGT